MGHHHGFQGWQGSWAGDTCAHGVIEPRAALPDQPGDDAAVLAVGRFARSVRLRRRLASGVSRLCSGQRGGVGVTAQQLSGHGFHVAGSAGDWPVDC